MEMVYFTIVAVFLYIGADRLLNTVEQRRGARFEQRSLIFFAILFPAALAAFWIIRALMGE